MTYSPLQKAVLKANKTIFKTLPSFSIIFPERDNLEVSGYMNSQYTNFQREDAGYSNIVERIFSTDRSKLNFTPRLQEKVIYDGCKYEVKQVTVQEPSIRLTLIKDLY